MKYRYFRWNSYDYKVRTDEPQNYEGNTERNWVTDSPWVSTAFDLYDMEHVEGAVEFFPDTEQPTYRYFRQGCGEWKVQTADPESTEGNFYRNAETPWLSASHSLSDLLAMGATEVGASEEQVPRWAVAIVFEVATTVGWQTIRTTSVMLSIAQADTEEQAVGLALADLHQKNPGAVAHKPITIQVS